MVKLENRLVLVHQLNLYSDKETGGEDTYNFTIKATIKHDLGLEVAK